MSSAAPATTTLAQRIESRSVSIAIPVYLQSAMGSNGRSKAVEAQVEDPRSPARRGPARRPRPGRVDRRGQREGQRNDDDAFEGTLTNALGVRRLGWSGATRAAQTNRPAATVSAAATPTRKRPRVATTAVRSAAACLCAQSHHTSRPNDSQSRASAPASAAGSEPAARRCRRHRQNDSLNRGDDLAPVAGRQRLTHPRQQPPGYEERVACRADREDPRAGRGSDVHAEDEDQECVDLTVEALPCSMPCCCVSRPIRRPDPA